MSISNQHEPCFRIYLGKSNWVNLNPQVTADLKAIYEEGKPTRYKLAPGLFIDILPRDVDCNSKTTELPRLMRADLCYDDSDDGNILAKIKINNENNQDTTATSSSSSSPTMAERQEVVQQNLSRFIKAELEKQGIVDAFPPNDPGQELLPHVSTLAPHRHLGLVPAPHKNTKRTLQRQKQPLDTEKLPTSSTQLSSSLSSSLASSSSPLLDTSHTSTSGRPTTKRKQPLKKTRKDDKFFSPSSDSSSSDDTASSISTQTKTFEKKIQPPPPYHLRSSTSSSATEKKARLEKTLTPPSTKDTSPPLTDGTYFSQTPLVPYQSKLVLDYEGEYDDGDTAGDNTNTNGSERTDFFPSIDFVTPTTQISPLWYTNFQQQPQQTQRAHPITLSSPPLPIFHHHHHHHHQFQLQPRDHQYHHARLQHFPDDAEDDDDNTTIGWGLHEETNRHHYHQQQQQQQQQQNQNFGMYSTSMHAVSSPPTPHPPIHRYDHTLPGRCFSGSQYTNTPHLPFLFMPPASVTTPAPAMTHVDDASTNTTMLMPTSSPSPTSSSPSFTVPSADAIL